MPPGGRRETPGPAGPPCIPSESGAGCEGSPAAAARAPSRFPSDRDWSGIEIRLGQRPRVVEGGHGQGTRGTYQLQERLEKGVGSPAMGPTLLTLL